MSMHKISLSEIEESGLRAHGLDIGTPSQLSDVFRQGLKYGQTALSVEIADLKRQLEEATYELANKNERIKFLEQMRDAAIHDNKRLNDLKEMWKHQSDNHLLHLCEMVTENESLKEQLVTIKDENE